MAKCGSTAHQGTTKEKHLECPLSNGGRISKCRWFPDKNGRGPGEPLDT